VARYLGADEEDFPNTAAHAAYAVLEDTLEPLLHDEWAGWTDEIDTVVDSGLATGGKNAFLYLITARRIASPPPQFLDDLLSRVRLLAS
jgi:putative ATP-dependent endonuclease of OLD family